MTELEVLESGGLHRFGSKVGEQPTGPERGSFFRRIG
jgi:hypothetical protein